MDIFKATQFNLSDYLQIIFRRKWLFIIPFLTVFLTVMIGSFFLPKMYCATAKLLVEEKQLLEPLLRQVAVAPTIQQRLNVLKEQILSWERLEVMSNNLGLTKNIKGERELTLFIRSLRERIIVESIGEFLIKISFEDQNPKVARDVVNSVTKTLVEENLSNQEEEAKSAIKFIEEQVNIYKQKLEDSEAALKEFKEKYLLELPGSPGSDVGRAIEAQDALLQIKLDLQEAIKTKQILQKQLSEQEKIITSKTTATNPVIEQLNAKLIDFQIQLNELKSNKCTDDHPMVISLKR